MIHSFLRVCVARSSAAGCATPSPRVDSRRSRRRAASHMRGRNTGSSSRYDSCLEQENDAHIGLLAGKVAQLKQLSIDIKDHVRDDNKMIGELDGSFDSTGGLLQGTMKRMGTMLSSKDSRHMLFLAVFVLFTLLLLYKMLR